MPLENLLFIFIFFIVSGSRGTPAMGLHLDVVPGLGKHLCCRQDNPTEVWLSSCANFDLYQSTVTTITTKPRLRPRQSL